jgi:hypothetical protein
VFHQRVLWNVIVRKQRTIKIHNFEEKILTFSVFMVDGFGGRFRSTVTVSQSPIMLALLQNFEWNTILRIQCIGTTMNFKEFPRSSTKLPIV